MISDAAYLQQVRDILADPRPDSEMAREGFGREAWVESLEPVADGPYEELEVVFGLAVRKGPELRGVSSHGVARIPFGREWRRLSGYTDPARFADRVAREIMAAGRRLNESPRRATVDIAGLRADLPTPEELWVHLVDELQTHGIVRQIAVGVLELVEADGTGVVLTVLVTPEQWYDAVVSAEVVCRLDHGMDAWEPGDGPSLARFELAETIESRHDDDRFLVAHHGHFSASIREELPPIRGIDAARG